MQEPNDTNNYWFNEHPNKIFDQYSMGICEKFVGFGENDVGNEGTKNKAGCYRWEYVRYNELSILWFKVH